MMALSVKAKTPQDLEEGFKPVFTDNDYDIEIIHSNRKLMRRGFREREVGTWVAGFTYKSTV